MNQNIFNDIKIYLPKYLSDEKQLRLFEELASFNIDKRFYSSYLLDFSNLFQGDGIVDLPLYNFKENKKTNVKGLVVSNSCDMDANNKRMFNPYVTFAPIFSLNKWEQLLRKSESNVDKINSHIEAIRQQRVTSFFYLPIGTENFPEESFVRFDMVCSIPGDLYSVDELINHRLFCLSNYAFYLLVLKLSIHTSRVQEKIDRDYA